MASKKSKKPASKSTVTASSKKKQTVAKKSATKTNTQKKATKPAVTTSRVSREETKFSKPVLVALSVGFFVLSYAFASWAIDSGSLWHYLFTFITVYFAVSYLQKAIR